MEQAGPDNADTRLTTKLTTCEHVVSRKAAQVVSHLTSSVELSQGTRQLTNASSWCLSMPWKQPLNISSANNGHRATSQGPALANKGHNTTGQDPPLVPALMHHMMTYIWPLSRGPPS
jgi:hypothetical protein